MDTLRPPLKLTLGIMIVMETITYTILLRFMSIDQIVEPQLKRQSNEWRHYGSPCKAKVRHTPTNVEFVVILLYDSGGIILTRIILQR